IAVHVDDADAAAVVVGVDPEGRAGLAVDEVVAERDARRAEHVGEVEPRAGRSSRLGRRRAVGRRRLRARPIDERHGDGGEEWNADRRDHAGGEPTGHRCVPGGNGPRGRPRSEGTNHQTGTATRSTRVYDDGATKSEATGNQGKSLDAPARSG